MSGKEILVALCHGLEDKNLLIRLITVSIPTKNAGTSENGPKARKFAVIFGRFQYFFGANLVLLRWFFGDSSVKPSASSVDLRCSFGRFLSISLKTQIAKYPNPILP